MSDDSASRWQARVWVLLFWLVGVCLVALPPLFLDLEGEVAAELKDIFKDLGMALIIAGAIGLLYELRMREAFISEIEDTFKKINDLRDELNSAGIRRAYKNFTDVDIVDKFMSAKSIKLLQTYFGEAYINVVCTALREAMDKGDCRDIRILLIHPDSEHVEHRRSDIGGLAVDIREQVKEEVGKLRILYNENKHLFNRRDGKEKFEIKLYKSTPIMPIYGYDEVNGGEVNVVGVYWHGRISQTAPHLEIGKVGKQEPYFLKVINEHFEEIWKEAELPPEAWDSTELGNSREGAEATPAERHFPPS